MIKGIYFAVLLALSMEDVRTKNVNPYAVLGIYALGLIKTLLSKEDRWVSLTLTCVCFSLLFGGYVLVRQIVAKKGLRLAFGGADVRLIPGMMLVQGWDRALAGVFIGMLATVLWYGIKRRADREIPLVPWMSAGCFLVEIFYLFSERNML